MGLLLRLNYSLHGVYRYIYKTSTNLSSPPYSPLTNLRPRPRKHSSNKPRHIIRLYPRPNNIAHIRITRQPRNARVRQLSRVGQEEQGDGDVVCGAACGGGRGDGVGEVQLVFGGGGVGFEGVEGFGEGEGGGVPEVGG